MNAPAALWAGPLPPHTAEANAEAGGGGALQWVGACVLLAGAIGWVVLRRTCAMLGRAHRAALSDRVDARHMRRFATHDEVSFLLPVCPGLATGGFKGGSTSSGGGR